MSTTPCTNAIDLTKPGNPGESARQLLTTQPHVPSFKIMRSIECGPSYLLGKQTNSFRVDEDRCTTHLNLSVISHVVAKQLTLDLLINDEFTCIRNAC